MLKKQNRLTSTYEFNKTRRLGSKRSGRYFHIFYFNSDGADNVSKVGIVVTTKFSKSAPVRNRIKRIFREVVKQNFDKIKNGYWIVIHPKKISVDADYEKIASDFNKVLQEIPLSRQSRN